MMNEGNNQSATFDVEPPTRGLESVGPFSTWKVKLDGYAVPFIQGCEDDKGMFHLMLDERFGGEIPMEYANQVVWLIANAHAIGAGYSCFGENSQIANPYKCKMSGISITSDIETQPITDVSQ